MASNDKKIKADPAPKKEAPPKTEVAPKTEAASKIKSPSGGEPSKAEGGEPAAAAPADYSRGEGQKPVSQVYKDNWNAIFAKRKRR